MKIRVVALALAIAVVASWRGLPTVASKPAPPRLFRSDDGRFSIIFERTLPTFEWIAFGSARGDIVEVVISYGARGSHNSVGCYWAVAEAPSFHKPVSLWTLKSVAVFDVGIFGEANRRLVASTECRADGCQAPAVGGWIYPSLDILLGRTAPPVPVAIAIRSRSGADGNAALLETLRSFVGGIDLTDVEEFSSFGVFEPSGSRKTHTAVPVN